MTDLNLGKGQLFVNEGGGIGIVLDRYNSLVIVENSCLGGYDVSVTPSLTKNLNCRCLLPYEALNLSSTLKEMLFFVYSVLFNSRRFESQQSPPLTPPEIIYIVNQLNRTKQVA